MTGALTVENEKWCIEISVIVFIVCVFLSLFFSLCIMCDCRILTKITYSFVWKQCYRALIHAEIQIL